MTGKLIPADKINLKLITVSGKTAEFLFLPTDSVTHITQHVYDNWPAVLYVEADDLCMCLLIAWSDEQLPPTNILRLIYQGRFLHGNVTLAALHLAAGSTVVMHLVMRDQLPEPNNQSQTRDKTHTARWRCCCCPVS